jgi:RNA polymerase sigma-70 factor (ECF subfamily)
MSVPSQKHPVRDEDHEKGLLERIAAGDRRAFEELYLGYHRRLTRFLMRLVPRYEMAEEVLNDTFWVVWLKAGEFRGASRVSTWIMGIAYRRMLKTLRSELATSRRSNIDDMPNLPALDEPNRVTEIHDWVTRGLTQLPLEQRLAIELAYFLGHSCEEIADIMDCPVNTVKARMFHARDKLRQSLPQLGGYHPDEQLDLRDFQ